MPPIATIAATAATFAVLDAAWLFLAYDRLYKPAIGELLAPGPRPLPAAAFYLIYLVGVLVFVVSPALADGGWKRALLLGAGFGFVAYATYDLTNQATLKTWPVHVTLIDLAWGSFATAVAAAVGVAVGGRA